MSLHLKKFKAIVIVILIVSVVLGLCIVLPKNSKSLDLVTYSTYGEDDTTYLIEQCDDYFNVYHVDNHGNMLGAIYQPKITKEYYYWIFDIKYYQGKAYVVMYKNKTASNEGMGYSIYECDFDMGTLNSVVTLEENAQSIDYIVNDDYINVDYLCYEDMYYLRSREYSKRFSEDSIQNVLEDAVYCSKTIMDNYGGLYILSINSELYKVTDDGQYLKIYPKQDTIGRVTNVNYDGKDSIYFIDSISNRLLKYNISSDYYMDITDTISNAFDVYNMEHSTEYSIKDLENLSFISNGSFVSSINVGSSSNRYLLCTFDGKSINVIDSIEKSLTVWQNILYSALCILIVFLILSVVAMLIYIFKYKYVSLIVRVFAVLVVLVSIVLTVIFNGTKYYLTNAFDDIFNDNILYISQNRLNILPEISNEDVDILLNTDFNGDDYEYWSDVQNAIYNIVYFSPVEANSIMEYTNDAQTIEQNVNINNDYTCAVYLIDHNDDLVLIYNTAGNTNVPVEYYKSNYVRSVIEDVISSGQKRLVDDLYLMQMSSSVYSPIVSTQGDVVGVVEVNAISHQETSFVVESIINNSIVSVIIIVLILVTIILLLLYISLKPLKILNNKAIELSKKRLGVTVKPTGNNEITALSRQFNSISTELADSINTLKTLNSHYQYYVPNKICKILNKPDMARVSIGDTNSISVATLSVKMHFKGIDVDSNSFVDILNQLLNDITSIVEKYNGLIVYFDRHGIKILFNQDYHYAIRTSVAISEYVNQIHDDRYSISVNMLAFYDYCNFKIIGNNDRMSISVSGTNELDYSQLNSVYHSCSLIVTDTLINRLEHFFEVFETRFIGIVTIRGKSVKLYEVFNGNVLYHKNLKRIYKDSFEKAINLYLLKDYRGARNLFAEVFEHYPQDILSKEYIYLCDMALNKGGNV